MLNFSDLVTIGLLYGKKYQVAVFAERNVYLTYTGNFQNKLKCS